MPLYLICICALILVLIIIAIIDLIQPTHGLRRTVPVLGRSRYFFEKLGDKFHQYIVESNRDGLPFNRRQRNWIYATSKGEPNKEGFGTDMDHTHPDYFCLQPAGLPKLDSKENYSANFLPCKKIMGPQRKKPYQSSLFNLSGMSLGAISPKAIESLNKGAKLARCYHNTGEGGFSKYHAYGADVIFQIGPGNFGVRKPDGSFDIDKLKELVNKNPFIRAIQIKLSQGAKPHSASFLPAAKVKKEIAEIRGVAIGQNVISPERNPEFSNATELLKFAEFIANETGLPVGLKTALGKVDFWEELCELMNSGLGKIDFIQWDCKLGGTGSGTYSFVHHMGLPLLNGFPKIYKIFKKHNLHTHVVFNASGKLGFPAEAIRALAMGVDAIDVAREGLLSIGCLQTQHCHVGGSIVNGGCPVGIATMNKWSQRAIKPEVKSLRFARYIKTLRKETLDLAHASGYAHPSEFSTKDVFMNSGDSRGLLSLYEMLNYEK